MNEKSDTLKTAATGLAVGLGLTVVALAVFVQMPVGKDLLHALKTNDHTSRPIERAPDRKNLPEAHTTESVPANDSPEMGTSLLNGSSLPDSITLIESVSVRIGRSEVILEAGESLSVTSVKDTFFLCSYLGDTIAVPIPSTDWSQTKP